VVEESLKEKILELRRNGKTYNEIVNLLGCKKSNVSYHCRMNHIGGDVKLLTDEERKEKDKFRVKTHRQKIKQMAINYKGGCCQECGYNKCNAALEFHHLDPNEKDFGIGSYTVLSWDKVKIELDKCILVCANCHREIHDELNN
jgi:hypothetical protein